MSKKNRNNEMVNLKITRSQAQYIQSQLEKADRPNVFKRMGYGVKDGTFATGRLFKKGYTSTATVCSTGVNNIISKFKSYNDMAERAHQSVMSVRHAGSKEDLVKAAQQLETIATHIRGIAEGIEFTEEKPEAIVVTEDTVAQPCPA